MQAALKRDWIRSAWLVQKTAHQASNWAAHSTVVAVCLQWGTYTQTQMNSGSEWARESDFWDRAAGSFYTRLQPRMRLPSNHWWWCLAVNISYVCSLAVSVSVVQGEASLSWCTRSHKVNKTLACVSSQSALRMQSCVAFWLRQAIKNKTKKTKQQQMPRVAML